MASFIEAYLHKALADIAYDDFKAFCGRRLDENQTLEYKSGELLVGYKGEYIRNGRLDKARAHEGFIKLATSIAGLANAQGGLFVLGVKEVLVRDPNGQIIGKRPGAIYPVPDSIIQKEMIEDKLRELIQFPIDDLTILPLRTTKRGMQSIYLFDVPQSVRVPHRVNQSEYPQRYNFETRPMVHYQISDLFGKRFAPDLDLQVEIVYGASNQPMTLQTTIYNFGRAIAKYPMCIWEITEGPYHFTESVGNKTVSQYIPGPNIVIYPYVHHSVPSRLIAANSSDTMMSEPITLEYTICAESTSAQRYVYRVYPIERRIELISKSFIQ